MSVVCVCISPIAKQMAGAKGPDNMYVIGEMYADIVMM